MYKAAITAHRDLAESDHDVIFNTMADLLTDPDLEAIYFGGASGGDTVALQACLDITMMNRPKLIVVVPDQLTKQHPGTWWASRQADELIEMGLTIQKSDGWAAYHARDRYMVDHADKLIAFWDGIKKGGTYNTKVYGEALKKYVIPVSIIGRNK
ncbi:MAG TPA: hypothetical protein VM577_05625 [Anaerovoracaceae bacterium]|nr:hypothetical protein [Anaerovoracaceae bacterium]